MANGISSDRGGLSNAAILAAPGVQATPAVADFMQAFRTGAITTDDLIRRGFQLPAEIAKAQQDVQEQREIRPLVREAQRGALTTEIELQPRRRKLAAGQLEQGIQALPTPAEQEASTAERAKTAQVRNSLASTVPGVREKAIAQLSNEQVSDLWTSAHGQPPPEQIEVPGEGGVSEPAPIDEWYINNFGNVPEGVSGRDFFARPDIQAKYEAYTQEARNRPLTIVKGTPEYAEQLRRDLKETNLKEALQGFKLKALGAGLEAQAKAAAEAPKAAADVAGKLRAEIEGSAQIKAFRQQEQAANLVNTLATLPNPSNRTDLQLIYAGVKLADPGSVVREGEIALSRQADPVLVQMKKRLEGITSRSGKLLDPTDRAEFVRIGQTVLQASQNQIRPEFQKFQRLGEQQGIPLENILSDTEASISRGQALQTSGQPAGQTGGAAPSAGTQRVIQNGVTFEWNGSQYVPVQ